MGTACNNHADCSWVTSMFSSVVRGPGSSVGDVASARTDGAGSPLRATRDDVPPAATATAAAAATIAGHRRRLPGCDTREADGAVGVGEVRVSTERVAQQALEVLVGPVGHRSSSGWSVK